MAFHGPEPEIGVDVGQDFGQDLALKPIERQRVQKWVPRGRDSSLHFLFWKHVNATLHISDSSTLPYYTDQYSILDCAGGVAHLLVTL